MLNIFIKVRYVSDWLLCPIERVRICQLRILLWNKEYFTDKLLIFSCFCEYQSI